MPWFRKKSNGPVEAVQLTWSNWGEVCDFVGPFPPGMKGVYLDEQGKPSDDFPGDQPNGDMAPIGLVIEGALLAGQGDWIIRDTDGELYPDKPEYFIRDYEPLCGAYSPSFAHQVEGDPPRLGPCVHTPHLTTISHVDAQGLSWRDQNFSAELPPEVLNPSIIERLEPSQIRAIDNPRGADELLDDLEFERQLQQRRVRVEALRAASHAIGGVGLRIKDVGYEVRKLAEEFEVWLNRPVLKPEPKADESAEYLDLQTGELVDEEPREKPVLDH